MKRSKRFSVLITILTVVIISISAGYDKGIAGCAGDCMTCHPKLIGDIKHSSLTTCIKCHEPVKKESFSLSQGGCGDRCFQCHEEWPKDSSHVSLNTCLDCHEK
ncbi:hypothetical protein [uncultured Brachyspira sp.]|uniref:hypothetical protein n=1 Tax=uncultured Brachyspira sp. TaxID=221953 RepID=UPI002602A962|nr:hypothetical protein [uncultured Brachyspira sp.]